jgi:hypothetical protein
MSGIEEISEHYIIEDGPEVIPNDSSPTKEPAVDKQNKKNWREYLVATGVLISVGTVLLGGVYFMKKWERSFNPSLNYSSIYIAARDTLSNSDLSPEMKINQLEPLFLQ